MERARRTGNSHPPRPDPERPLRPRVGAPQDQLLRRRRRGCPEGGVINAGPAPNRIQWDRSPTGGPRDRNPGVGGHAAGRGPRGRLESASTPREGQETPRRKWPQSPSTRPKGRSSSAGSSLPCTATRAGRCYRGSGRGCTRSSAPRKESYRDRNALAGSGQAGHRRAQDPQRSKWALSSANRDPPCEKPASVSAPGGSTETSSSPPSTPTPCARHSPS